MVTLPDSFQTPVEPARQPRHKDLNEQVRAAPISTSTSTSTSTRSPLPLNSSHSARSRTAPGIPDRDTPNSNGTLNVTGEPASTSTSSASNRLYHSNASPRNGEQPRLQSYIATSDSSRKSHTTANNLASTGPSIPHIRVNEPSQLDLDHKSWLAPTPRPSTSGAALPGQNIQEKDHRAEIDFFSDLQGLSLDINIPTGGFAEDLSANTFQFSNRGSMLIDGKRLNYSNKKSSPVLAPIMDDPPDRIVEPTPDSSMRTTSVSIASKPPRTAHSNYEKTPARPLTTDEEILSEKVRAFYAAGTDEQVPTHSNTNLAAQMGARWQATLVTDSHSASIPSLSRATSTTDITEDNRNSLQPSVAPSGSGLSIPYDREELELAGGLEDWKDVENADVDRYGFILTRAPTSALDGADGTKPQKLTRVSTSLQLASETPRRKNTLRRAPSSAHGSVKSGYSRHSTSNADKTPPRPVSSQSASSRAPQGRRSTSSRIPLPGLKNRRLMESAGDMLTLPDSAQSIIEDGHVHVDDARAKRKEIEREEKWRRMARPLPRKTDPKTGKPIVGGGSGANNGFTFDTTSPKVIERTWKGVPDKWRATVWHSFLSTSASKRKDSLSDSVLIEAFHNYQSQASPDDVQIDIDVPRTISSHIMFRRRYRGGQRLLFRVLHAMSLHFAETGYVQGMAALAVTLLAYYDEEMTFVMLVRMWELRGLEELYKHGFGGLMSALNDFETLWLGKGEVGKKLDDLNITPTAYGTRWYLTLFNYTIPFPAQLRVWDVFMLLGDDTSQTPATSLSPPKPNNSKDPEELYKFGTTLDVLHATSAALIDGMRDILLSSDFENGMKVLTSWVPIQDPDLLMRIARAEWKMHLKKQ